MDEQIYFQNYFIKCTLLFISFIKNVMFCCRCFRARHMGLESQCMIPLVMKLAYEMSKLPVSCGLLKELSRFWISSRVCNKRLLFTVFRDFSRIFDKLFYSFYKISLVQDELGLSSTRFAIQGKKQDISVYVTQPY